jgi:hypothetical protein
MDELEILEQLDLIHNKLKIITMCEDKCKVLINLDRISEEKNNCFKNCKLDYFSLKREMS